jgi:hypothetical protein
MVDEPTRMDAALESAARLYNALYRHAELPGLAERSIDPDRAWLQLRTFEIVLRSQEAALQAATYLSDQFCDSTALGHVVTVHSAPYCLAVAAAAAVGLDHVTAIILRP